MSQSLPGRNDQPHIQQADLDQLFSRLDPREVEQFYQFYHTWQQQGRVEQLINEIETLQWRIAENDVLLRQAEPSTMVQADIALLETRGVVDIDLLDRMVGRGEIWLNRTIDLLQRCEELNMIGETYAAWCEHALEGAYEWMSTMEENVDSGEQARSDGQQQDTNAETDTAASPTEDAFIQMLMSEENEVAEASEAEDGMRDDDKQDEGDSVEPTLARAFDSDQSEQEPVSNGSEDEGGDQNEQKPASSDSEGKDSEESIAQQAEEDGIGDIEAQAAEDLEVEAQQVADFEQPPEEGTVEDSLQIQDMGEVEGSLPDDSVINPQEQAEDLHEQTEGDRHWPYILNTEEVEKDAAEPVANPQLEQAGSDGEQVRSGEDDEQEPQSLVQKLLTRVLRW